MIETKVNQMCYRCQDSTGVVKFVPLEKTLVAKCDWCKRITFGNKVLNSLPQRITR